ncbi:tetratricopeptide repeat protein [Gilvimarinus agarilyticus]|uniref:tetratricopeptide repeat protein n=1 Tax=Reichenbachiella agariperforans TaxID=156994 RepID=UPI001C088A8A|nr:tetratricopeptide repeat protein [Reichenbachiella agariperforans]MBU2884904.1 tetratricopeptide repeat protein [Gilvimarinus agarilyticus]MBU2915003.1 tetratricopeptide repeat protein [Reichenbachiella agariperforans]
MSIRSTLFAFVLLLLLGACRQHSHDLPTNTAVDHLLLQVETHPALNRDSSLFMTRRALILSEELNYPYGIARSSHLLGSILYKIGSLDLAINHLHIAIHQYELLDDPQHLAEATSMIGQVYLRSENYKQALIHLRESMALFTQMNNHTGEARIQGQLGHLFEKTEQYDSALYYQQMALDYFEQRMDSAELAAIYDNIGSIYEDLEVYDEAYQHFVKAYDFNQALGNIDEAIVNLNNIGDTYRKRQQYDSAIHYTRIAWQQATLQQNQYQVQSAARDLSIIYLETGHVDSAYYFLDQSYQLNETIFGHEIAKKIANAQTIFDLEKKQQTIQLLEKEKSLTRKVTLGGAIGLAILLLLVAYISYQRVTRSAKERKLLQIENELSKSELINAQLNEEKLRTELENKRLQETQLQMDLEMKNSALSRSALHLIQKNEFLETLRTNLKKIKKSQKEDVHQKISKLTKSIDLNFNMDEDWEEFENIFQQIHTEFFDQLRAKHPTLTNSEVRLCAMIHINLHSHEIASILSISSDSLRIARYRLRKKLGLEKGENLYNYIVSIG